MSKALRKLTGNLNKSNTTMIFINQIREKIGGFGFGPQTTTTGGRALKFYSSVRMEVKRVGSIKQGEDVIGNETQVKITKNKVAPPFKEVAFEIMYGKGISKIGEILDLAIKYDIVAKSGAWFSYGDTRLGQGRENVKTKLEEELKAIELTRDFTNHEFIAEGALWKFRTHQYRRSLAIYAQGSGLVSLYAIREQFGQLLTSMAEYYGNGNRNARQLDGRAGKEHISNYMRQIKPVIAALSFLKNVVLSKSMNFGSDGSYLEKNFVAKTQEDKEIAILKSSELIKKFKNGILHYQETAMGGCTTPYPCENFLLPDFFIYCKSCEHSIMFCNKL